MRLAVLAAAMLLAGCATRPPIETKVPVAVGCVGAVPARPAVTFGVGDWPGDKGAAIATQVDSLAFQSYTTVLEAIIAGCPKK